MLSRIGKVSANKMLDDLMNLRQIAEDISSNAQQRLKCSVEDPRVVAFGMIFNQVTRAFEILNFYKNIWIKKPPKEESSVSGRVMSSTKHFFVSSMSAIEFSGF